MVDWSVDVDSKLVRECLRLGTQVLLLLRAFI